MHRDATVHKVGLTAGVLGLLALTVLPYATFRGSRIQTGEPIPSWDALGHAWFALLAVVWVALVVLSLCGRGRVLSITRGLTASIALVGIVWLSAVAADRLLAGAPTFARVSIGTGAWAAMIAGYMAIIASRRDLGAASPAGVALSLIAPVGIVALLASGSLQNLGMLQEYANQKERFVAEVAVHLTYSAIALGVAVAVGVGLGVLAFRYPQARKPVFATVSVFQTVPGLAMVGLLFGPLAWLGSRSGVLHDLGVGGLGWAPVIVALTLYALLAVVRNTCAGLESVPPEAIDAGYGMGMTEHQLMRRVRFPLAMPAIFGGVRTAGVQTIGNATIGAFVAAGTLGLFVFGGLSQQATDLVMLGSVAMVALAMLVDGLFRMLQRLVTGGTHRVVSARRADD